MASSTATEVYGKSESGSINKDGQRSVSRIFHVAGTVGNNLTLQDALIATGLPSEPSGGNAGDTLTVGGETLSYWGTRSFQRVAGHEDLWVLTYEYSTSPDPSGGGDENEESGGAAATTKGVYRAQPRLPVNVDNPSKEDIQGTPVDVGGTKTSVVFPQATQTIKEYRTLKPSITEFASMVGKRNANYWNGLAVGVVLFTGVRYSENKGTSKWEIEYDFAIDYLTYHLEQVAKTKPDGSALTTMFGEGDNATVHAKRVYFVQPFQKSFFGFPT